MAESAYSVPVSTSQKMRPPGAIDVLCPRFARAWRLLRSGRVTEQNSLHEDLTEQIIACAITVHDTLGPGLLESIYQRRLVVELRAASLQVETERYVPVLYRGSVVGPPLKLDLVVAGSVIVEVKAVQSFVPVHHAQVISYLKLRAAPLDS